MITDTNDDGDVSRDHFVCGQTGMGRTTFLVNWFWKVADGEEESSMIDRHGVDRDMEPRINSLDREIEGVSNDE